MLKCPECGSANLIKYGIGATILKRQIIKAQRYLCKECKLVTTRPKNETGEDTNAKTPHD